MNAESQVASPESRVLGTAVLVRALIAQRLRLPDVDPDVPLSRLGFDSLACVELAADVEAALGVRVPVDAVTECTTIASLCAVITAESRSSVFDVMRADAVPVGAGPILSSYAADRSANGAPR